MILKTRMKRLWILTIRNRHLALPALSIPVIMALYQNCGAQFAQDRQYLLDPSSTPSPLTLYPGNPTLSYGQSITFYATGGSGSGYAFSLLSGIGSLNQIGQYTAPASGTQQCAAVVQVKDSAGAYMTATVTVMTSGNTPTPTPTSTPVAVPYFQLLTRYRTCVDIDSSGGVLADWARIQSNSCLVADGVKNIGQEDAQRWGFRPVSANGGTLHEIVSKKSGKCLTVEGFSSSDEARISQLACSQAANQLWVASQENGSWRFKAVHSGKCLDLRNGGVFEQFQQYTCSAGHPNQLFLRVKAEPFTRNRWYLLRQSGGKCLASGNPVRLLGCSGGSDNQLFQFVPFTGSSGPYQIKVKDSGKCLDSGSGNGNIVQTPCGTGYQAQQLWTVGQSGPFTFIRSVSSGQCINLDNGNQSDGTGFNQRVCNTRSNSQSFLLDLP